MSLRHVKRRCPRDSARESDDDPGTHRDDRSSSVYARRGGLVIFFLLSVSGFVWFSGVQRDRAFQRETLIFGAYPGLRFARNDLSSGARTNILYLVERALRSIRIIRECQISISSICEIRRDVRLLFNISNISSQYFPFIHDPSLV